MSANERKKMAAQGSRSLREFYARSYEVTKKTWEKTS